MSDYEEEDIDYGDFDTDNEYEKDTQMEEEDPFGDYKDSSHPEIVTGYAQLANVGGPDDPFAIGLTSDIESGRLRKLQQSSFYIETDPNNKFRKELHDYVLTKQMQQTLGLETNDIQILAKSIEYLPLIKYKSAQAYVLSYYIRHYVPVYDTNKVITNQDSTLFLQGLKTIKEQLNESNVTFYDIIKYAQFWHRVVSH